MIRARVKGVMCISTTWFPSTVGPPYLGKQKQESILHEQQKTWNRPKVFFRDVSSIAAGFFCEMSLRDVA